MKKSMLLIGCLFAFFAQAATLEVRNVVIQQRYPWNGLVDIDYEVVCDDPDADIYVYPVGHDADRNISISPRTLTGAGSDAPVKAGAHRMTWNMTADDPTLNSTAFSMKMHAISGAAPYLVVDLSGGTTAQSYPVSYMAAPPEGGWSDEYKGNKLVLRLIFPGTFTMGSPSTELGRYTDEYLHQVTLTEPFYMGVFEVTQKQWQLVMGTTPSSDKGDFRPVECISYGMIRGTSNGAGWPTHNQVDATSFMGVFRVKTGLTFDLPTEAQWEYACRAGTSTALNSGKDLTATETCSNMAEVGRYSYNRSDGKGGYTSGHTKVGSYLPNAWGLYDMHGNVYEWCLDWYTANLGTATVTNPKGATSGSSRVSRGGYWGFINYSPAQCCRSAARNYGYTRAGSHGLGLRVLAFPAVQE